ncbi:S-adenosyl-L-methionine-dependent methyltransferase [Trichoderma citrinoviride]|uniref:S-adenosyl-L-methionine-dependent methyltransferase n=1 Tax=Trichoderma citrinoviride TaxID=58853 RepID=A0A2T4B630_9HYPO|nr:S-adenosyl-L-methionine-dependent methyltransferase [Trichoderma citrinoviride]PTB64785.1 S-adenosyl-L-methionine-dependent methyltransferase [Trichoderma citrinoviride]
MSEHLKDAAQAQDSFEQDFIRLSHGIMKIIVEPLVNHMGFYKTVAEPVVLLDSACGSGVLTQEVQAALSDEVLAASSFTCADNAVGMVDLVKRRIVDEKWVNTEARVLDAMNTGLPDNTFSHVGVALALHLTPDPDAVVKDCIRILKPGGTFGASTWPKANADMFWIPDMRTALESLPFDAPPLPAIPMQMHHSGHWDDAAWVETHLARDLGLTNVSVRESGSRYRFASADEFMATFSMMVPWMMNTFWSDEVREKHSVDEVRGLVKRHLEDKYGGHGWSIGWRVITMTATVSK